MKTVQSIPGTLCNKQLWQGLQQALAGTLKMQHVPIEQATAEAGILAKIQAASDVSPHLCGFSMGGYYALAHAVTNPRLESLVVLGGTYRKLQPKEMAQRRKAVHFLEDMRQQKYCMPQKRIEEFVSPDSARFTHVAQVIREMEADLGNSTLIAQLKMSLQREDLTDQLHKISCPVLIIGGEKDEIVKPAELERMADLIANARLHILPGLSHMLPLEAPESVARLLQDFYQQPTES